MRKLLLPLLVALTIPTSVKANDLDISGMPKLKQEDGWYVLGEKSKRVRMIVYVSNDVRRLMVRGIYGRYITYPSVMRLYRPPKAATPTQVYSSGDINLNCTEIGSSINCSGYGPSITTIPGDPGRPAETIEYKRAILIDCLDNIYNHIDQKVPSKEWKPIKTPSYMSNVAKKFCGRIAELKKSEITDYKEGEPNEKDIKALSTTF